METLSWLVNNFKEFGKDLAIITQDKQYSYSELFEKVTKLKKFLAQNQINQGEVVAIVSDYSLESISLLLALIENKNIIVPIASKVQSSVDEKIETAYCDKVITINEKEFFVRSLVFGDKHQMIQTLTQSQSAGLILFSSGSTGKPKAMIHNLDNMINQYKNKKNKSMNMLLFLMFDHIGGLNTLFNILAIGATMIIPNSRDVDEVCGLIEKYKISILPSSPTFLNLILMSESNKKYDLSSLRLITYGTEAMPESLLIRLKNSFPKAKFLQTFGTSETGIATTSSKSSNSTFMKIDTTDLEYKIVDNELWLKSKTQVLGYLNASMESFSDDGWFKTGDLVEADSDGYLKIIGRAKEIINVGGEKVLPCEVESIILQMPEILDCMVYGEKNAITGESVVVDVVLRDNELSSSIKKLIRSYCKDKLDNYKIPTKAIIVEHTNFGERFKKIRSNHASSTI
jgi:acyl-CoA synthetase (AMP-forming)/AMP-acid ligase II